MARPLWMSFPHTRATHAHDASFMLGDAVLVTPVLEEGAVEARDALFPPGLWYDAFRPGREGLVDARASPEGLVRSLPAPLGHVPVHFRGGSVLALGAAARALRTAQVRGGPLVLVAALGGAEGRGMEANAGGWVYMDGGEELQPGRCACHFARVDVRVWRAEAQDLAGGEAQLAFGLPEGFRAGDECDSAKVEWPVIAGLHVWDWEEARAVPTVTVTVRRGGTERAAEHVLERKVRRGMEGLDWGKVQFCFCWACCTAKDATGAAALWPVLTCASEESGRGRCRERALSADSAHGSSQAAPPRKRRGTGGMPCGERGRRIPRDGGATHWLRISPLCRPYPSPMELWSSICRPCTSVWAAQTPSQFPGSRAIAPSLGRQRGRPRHAQGQKVRRRTRVQFEFALLIMCCVNMNVYGPLV